MIVSVKNHDHDRAGRPKMGKEVEPRCKRPSIIRQEDNQSLPFHKLNHHRHVETDEDSERFMHEHSHQSMDDHHHGH